MTEYRSPGDKHIPPSPAPLAFATARARRVGSPARALSSQETLPLLIVFINSPPPPQHGPPSPSMQTQRTDSPTDRKPCPPFRLPPPISSHTTWDRPNPENAEGVWFGRAVRRALGSEACARARVCVVSSGVGVPRRAGPPAGRSRGPDLLVAV